MVCPGWGKEGCYMSQTVVGTLGAAMGLLQLECSQSTTAVARNTMGSSTTTIQLDGEFLCFFQQHCQDVWSLSFPGPASIVGGWCLMKCLFCNVEKVSLLEKQTLGCSVGVFFPLLFIPLFSVSREFQIRKKDIKVSDELEDSLCWTTKICCLWSMCVSMLCKILAFVLWFLASSLWRQHALLWKPYNDAFFPFRRAC